MPRGKYEMTKSWYHGVHADRPRGFNFGLPEPLPPLEKEPAPPINPNPHNLPDCPRCGEPQIVRCFISETKELGYWCPECHTAIPKREIAKAEGDQP